tara:strand:- start:357 stop:773 length:417 start_codon:yes stop_codon:yes gene_type:complete
MNKSKPFLKVEHELIDDQVLTPTQKCLLMLLRRLQTAPKGCTPSHLYLKKRLKLKSSKTLVRNLDRLQLLGYITWQNRGKGNTNRFIFRGQDNFQSILLHNLRLRTKMSKQQKILYEKRKLKQAEKEGVILLKQARKV